MQAVACPQCGAPIQGPVSGPIYQCPYCKQTSKSQVPVAPQFVIIQQPTAFHAPQHNVYVQAPTRAYRPPILPFLMPLLIVAIVMGVTFREPLMNLTGIGQWDGSEPLVCDGNDEVSVNGVNAKFTQGAAIVVRGNCHVKLKDCTIQSPIAIDASGNGGVTVTNGSVIGEIDASGNAHVDIVGNAKASGAVKKRGNARFNGR